MPWSRHKMRPSQHEEVNPLEHGKRGIEQSLGSRLNWLISSVQQTQISAYFKNFQTIILTCSISFAATLAIFFVCFPEYLDLASTALNRPPAIRTIESASNFEVIRPKGKNHSSYRSYRSSPIRPPHLNITRYEGDLADGVLLLTPKSRETALRTIKAPAPYILSSDGDLIYAHNRTNHTNNFRVQTTGGKSFLQWWQGKSVLGHGYGRAFMLDEEYQESFLYLQDPVIYEFKLPHQIPGYMDFHEQQVTKRGTILVTAYSNVLMDLSHIKDGPKNGVVANSMFFEVDIETGKTLFRWSAIDHFPVNGSRLDMKSYMGNGQHLRPYDFFHINSIQDLEKGYLISSRHFWSVYLVSKEDGRVLWALDGSGDRKNGGGSFGQLPDKSQFRWQHDAVGRVVNDTYMEISLFDNHYMREAQPDVGSRGLHFGLQLPPNPLNVPALLKMTEGPVDFHADSQGSYDPFLSGGNQLISFGPIPVIQEYGPLGDLRWEARYADDNAAMSYRVFKQEWHATPKSWNPSLVIYESAQEHPEQVEHDDGTISVAVTAYVSWNGATEVSAWDVYVGAEPGGGLTTWRGEARKRGFETAFQVMLVGDERCIQVAAVQAGKRPRRSNSACLGDEPSIFEEPYDEEYDF